MSLGLILFRLIFGRTNPFEISAIFREVYSLIEKIELILVGCRVSMVTNNIHQDRSLMTSDIRLLKITLVDKLYLHFIRELPSNR